MAIHHVTVTIGAVAAVGAVGEIVVWTSNELAPALKQREKTVVIEEAQLARRFQKLMEWREARNWFVAVVGAGIIAYAISMNYKIEIGFEKDFKLQKLNGKIILTPTRK